ncbi:hypothetical protein FBUS_03528 [Fasciolopsis buskii]|uniref:Uncharacterized protein n=1 Tax=Fasciolopsis buskii TaxID=27845 RepID=A0A8E0VQY2_9TREM|nr:hypothetical protein FBUS_03528 [Fasciolopsis buski]
MMLMPTTQSIVFIKVPELYPLETRSKGFWFSPGLGRLGAAISSYVNQLDYNIAQGVPMMFYTGMASLVAAVTWCMDDTTSKEENLNPQNQPKEEGDFSALKTVTSK